MREFDGFDFAVGSVTGLRRWNVDDLGRLRGVSHDAVWRPGENLAKCPTRHHDDSCPAKGSEYYPLLGYIFHSSSTVTYPFGNSWTSAPSGTAGTAGTGGGAGGTTAANVGSACTCEPKPRPALHNPDTCGCGFWAYHGEGETHGGEIAGVIKGYGKTVIGTKGFRCEKAEIVALCLPGKVTQQILPWLWLVYAFAAVVLLANSVLYAVAGQYAITSFSAAVALAIGILAEVMRRDDRPKVVNDSCHERIKANYPNIPVYPTVAKMLKAHPLTPSVAPTPETDPDFWERP